MHTREFPAVLFKSRTTNLVAMTLRSADSFREIMSVTPPEPLDCIQPLQQAFLPHVI